MLHFYNSNDTIQSIIEQSFVSGNNEYGQLALQHNKYQRELVSSFDFKDIKKISSSYHTFILTSDGSVFASGRNDTGQLGIGSNIDSNILVNIVLPEKIIDLSVGENHSLLLSQTGNVYVSGDNTFGQMGNINSSDVPIVNTQLISFNKVIAKSRKSFFISDTGNVFCCGQFESNIIDPIQITANILDEHIIDVSGYRDRFFFLSKSGNVFFSEDVKSLIQIKSNILDTQNILKIAAGINHVSFLTDSGNVYNEHFQLIHNDIQKIASEYNYSLYLKTDGNVYLDNQLFVDSADVFDIFTGYDCSFINPLNYFSSAKAI